jgi:hypothetical protein
MTILGVTASSIFKSNAALDSIATVTGNGSSASITLSSIPQTYKSLHLRIYGKTTSTSLTSPQNIVCSTLNAGTFTQSLISYNINSSILFSSGLADSRVARAATSNTSWSNVTTPTILDIYNYTSTSIGKTWRSLSGGSLDTNSYSNMQIIWGANNSTSAISSLTFTAPDPFATSTVIALYGVK